MTTGHVIERTSPKGEDFRGTCMLCGATDLKATDALTPCPNPNDVPAEDALLLGILGGDLGL